MQKEEVLIVTVVLTGGPCSAKTTMLNPLGLAALQKGWKALMIEEPATAYFNAHPGSKERLLKAFEEVDVATIVEIETAITHLSFDALSAAVAEAHRAGGKWLILFDRAIPDNRAYLPANELGDDIYRTLFKKCGFTSATDVLLLYSAVIKLTTAANGAEPFYQCDNNDKRHENLEQARALDLRFESVYADHPRFYAIDNSTDLGGKIDRTVETLISILDMAVKAA